MANTTSGVINTNILNQPYTITVADDPVLKITADGYLQLGEDFKMPVSELIASLKAARNLALKEYPEDFV